MALQTGRNSPNRNWENWEEELPIVAEINITPLTDIFLVLLIIFMVTSSALNQMGVDVQLPKANQASSSSENPGIIVTITKDNQILVNAKPVQARDLQVSLRELLAKTNNKTIIVEGDRRAVLETMVFVMDEGKKAGAGQFAVATTP